LKERMMAVRGNEGVVKRIGDSTRRRSAPFLKIECATRWNAESLTLSFKFNLPTLLEGCCLGTRNCEALTRLREGVKANASSQTQKSTNRRLEKETSIHDNKTTISSPNLTAGSTTGAERKKPDKRSAHLEI